MDALLLARRSTEPTLGFPSLSSLRAKSADDSHGPFQEALLRELMTPGGAPSQAVRDLEEFVHRLFVLNMPRQFWLANTVALGIITSLLLAGSLTVVHRLYKRKFWLWKITRRSEGVYFIPNALNGFLISEGAFALLYIAFSSVQWLAYERRVGGAQDKIAALHIVVWVPLWLGAYFAGWGSFFTAPGAFERGPWSNSRFGRWFPRPLFINIVCFGTPVLLMGSLAPVIVLGQRQLSRSYVSYQAFSAVALAAANAGSTVDPATTRLLLQGASAVWRENMLYIWYMSLGWIIWPIFASLFLIFYIPAGGYLLWLVYNQLRRQQKLLKDIEVRQKAPSRNRFSQISAEHPQAHSPEGPSESLLFQPLGTDTTSITMTVDRRPQEPKSDAAEHESDGGRKEKFFPPLRPDIHKKAARRLRDAGSPLSRYRYLRRCFLNILMLYVSISIGAIAYLAISATLGAWIFRARWRGTQDLTNLYYGCNVASSWVAAIFGSLAFASIWLRFFDPANAPSDEEEKQVKRKPIMPAFARGSNKTETIDLSPHDKTRTLPAVPESVGPATFEFGSTSGFGDEENSKFSTRRRRPSEVLMAGLDATASQLSISIPGAEALRNTRSTRRKQVSVDDLASAVEREVEQTESQRSYRSGRTVYYPTPFGPMAAPARDIPKPLPPARTPPRILTLPDDARISPRASTSTPTRVSLGSMVRSSGSRDSLVGGPISRSGSSSALAAAYHSAESGEEEEYVAQSPTLTLVGSSGGPRSPTSARGWVQREWAAAESADRVVASRSSLSMSRSRRPSVLESTAESAEARWNGQADEESQPSSSPAPTSRWRSESLPPRPAPDRPLPAIPGPALFSHLAFTHHPAASPSRDAPYTSPNRPQIPLQALQPPPGAKGRRAVLSVSPRNVGDLPLVSPGVFF